MNRLVSFLKTYTLFGLQIFMAWVFALPQVICSFKSTAGMPITWSFLCTVFAVVNLFLAIGAYRIQKTNKSGQLIFVYSNWVLLFGSMFVAIALNKSWTVTDTILVAVVVLGSALVISVRWGGGILSTVTEPITRGIISLIVKSIPQLYVGYCIIHDGANTGLPWQTLLVGHITVCIRIGEIFFSAMTKGVGGQHNWSRHNIGLLISEVGNEITWCVTTVIWSLY